MKVEPQGDEKHDLAQQKIPVVRFQPPLFLQRRALIYSLLKELSTPCTSLLDVGTGEGELLSFLRRCDDEVPITRMDGLDPDRAAIDLAIGITRPNDMDTEETRWRPLQVSLYQGGLRCLINHTERYDCVVSVEVLEHLDPPDFEAFGAVLLGHLRPKYCIVTTPNRDFNEVFARIERNQNHTFRRPGVDYDMRHHDHRFEMNRKEFQAWAGQQCSIYGYNFTVTGVGTVANAFDGQQAWRTTFPEENLFGKFGYCTQAAIFERIDHTRAGGQTSEHKISKAHVEDAGTLIEVISLSFPCKTQDRYPPTDQEILHIVLEAEGYFRPSFEEEMVYQSSGESHIQISCDELYDTCYALKIATRFHAEVFEAWARSMLNRDLLAMTQEAEKVDPASDDYHRTFDKLPQAILLGVEINSHNDELHVKFVFDTTAFDEYQRCLLAEEHEERSVQDWEDLKVDPDDISVPSWYEPEREIQSSMVDESW